MMNQTAIPSAEIELFKELPDIKVIVDVGIRVDSDYLDIYPNVELHGFEPNKEFYDGLSAVIGHKPNVHLNNYGIGDMNEERPYDPKTQSFMLPVTNPCISIRRLDPYLRENNIERIDFLKVDVEGYDLRVIAGNPNAVQMTRFLQYEHWDYKKPFEFVLSPYFDLEYIGYRNVLCMNKKLVPLKERNRLKRLIKARKYAELQ